MSRAFTMDLIVNLVPLLFSAALVYSDQSTVPLKSFKISENVIYDCIDIYKQPGLDHPLLRNHKIQMKPSFSPHDSTNKTGNNATYKTKIACPYGTVPILRNTKEFNTDAQIFAEKHFNQILADGLDPLTHIAGVRSEPGPYRGVQAFFKAYNLDLRDDEASYNQIYIGSGLNNGDNFLMTGLMINPSLYGNDSVWTFGFFQGKDGKGCYNTGCPGFVQLSPRNPIAFPVGMKPLEAGNIRCPIIATKSHSLSRRNEATRSWQHTSLHPSGNWWLSTLGYNSFKVDIGYWPKELFNLMDNGGNIVGAGGVVHASPFGTSPAMGHGQFPKQPVPLDGSPTFSDVKVMNSKYESHRMDYFPIEKLLDSPQCYGIEIGINEPPHHDHRGFFFDVGGPGGNTC
uniref:Neprosin PEP catalytic domain-containing protein n=1 Tax=Brassica campestris TaxID=3711 RepID=M4DCY5_BRACM